MKKNVYLPSPFSFGNDDKLSRLVAVWRCGRVHLSNIKQSLLFSFPRQIFGGQYSAEKVFNPRQSDWKQKQAPPLMRFVKPIDEIRELSCDMRPTRDVHSAVATDASASLRATAVTLRWGRNDKKSVLSLKCSVLIKSHVIAGVWLRRMFTLYKLEGLLLGINSHLSAWILHRSFLRLCSVL